MSRYAERMKLLDDLIECELVTSAEVEHLRQRAKYEALIEENVRLRAMILKLGQDWDSPSDETFGSTLGHFVAEVKGLAS